VDLAVEAVVLIDRDHRQDALVRNPHLDDLDLVREAEAMMDTDPN